MTKLELISQLLNIAISVTAPKFLQNQYSKSLGSESIVKKKKQIPLTVLDGPARANRFADPRGSPDSCESLQGFRSEPLFCGSRFRALKIANRRFEAIHATFQQGVFLLIVGLGYLRQIFLAFFAHG